MSGAAAMVSEPRDRARGPRKARRRRPDALAVDEHPPSVVERAKVIGGRFAWEKTPCYSTFKTLLAPAAISSTSFAGVTGVCAMRTPKGCSASSMAEMTAAAVGMVETSPAPLAPSGLSGDGVSR